MSRARPSARPSAPGLQRHAYRVRGGRRGEPDLQRVRRLAGQPGQGFAGPDTVAGVVAMPGSQDGAFITGTEIRIDGGTHF